MGGFRWGLGWFPSLVFFYLFIYFLSGFGGCGFVLVSVVAAMVVGGYCCGSGGCAVVVVDVGNEREEIIYYFNV